MASRILQRLRSRAQSLPVRQYSSGGAHEDHEKTGIMWHTCIYTTNYKITELATTTRRKNLPSQQQQQTQQQPSSNNNYYFLVLELLLEVIISY